LIRSHFQIDPKTLSEEEFSILAADALWLNHHNYSEQKAAVRDGALEAYTTVLKAKGAK